MLMKKQLRLLLLSLALMLTGNVMAQGVIFDFDNDYAKLFPTLAGTSANDSHDGDFTEATTSIAIEGFTVTVSAKDEGSSNANRIWSSAPRLRMYSGTFTVSGKGIKKIEFESNDKFNVTAGSGTLDGKVWTGEADEVVFNIGGNTQLKKLVINGDGGSVTLDPTPDPQPGEVQTVTIADFNAAAESNDVWYQLTGTIKNLKDGDQYGNFDLEDETGSVYVYGVLSEKGGAKKKFQELVAEKGIKEGDKLTIIGNRGSYNGKIEVLNAYFVSVESGGVTPDPTPDPQPGEVQTVTIADFNAAAESNDVWYQLTGTIKNLKDGDQYGNFDLEDETGSVYVYGVLSEKGGAKKKFQELVAEKGIKEGDKLTIIGNRGSYNGKIEVLNAYFVSVESGGVTPDPTPDPQPGEVQTVTIADFNAAAESNDVWYQLTGTIKNLKDGDQYGNFDLEDETGSVYVYGVLSEKGGAKKKFQELVAEKGIKEGDKLTIIGNRGSYNGKIEVTNAYFVSVNGKDAASVKALKLDVDVNVPAYNLSGQQVSRNYRGLIIRNGKKFMVK